MKRSTKKGFTIVELVIVIAVIAILAAVLIPTFSSLIKKANISSDTQLCKNMNTALSMAKAEGKSVNTMFDVLTVINDAGYVIENLNPTTEGYYFAWDSKGGQILFLNDEFELHYPTDASFEAATSWITVSSEKEAKNVASKGFALYLENDLESLALTTLTSVDAGAYVLKNLSVESTASGQIYLNGAITNVTLDIPNADAVQSGAVDTFTVTAVKDGTLTINGFVNNLTLKKGKVNVAKTGAVMKASFADDKDTNAKITVSGGIVMEGEGKTTISDATVVSIGTRAELEAFRDVVNAGYTYNGVTVQLTADIDLEGVAWLPIGNVYRGDVNAESYVFQGTFDGQNHTIKNLSNTGFSINGLALGKNKTTLNGYSEVVYGLFGSVYNAEFKNLTVSASIDMLPSESAKQLGDAVGAIVGFIGGETFKMENCKVTGTVKGHDNVGGLIGRVNTQTTVTLTGCTNEADVTAMRKCSGILGYVSGSATINATNCANNGTVTCLGPDKDIEAKSDDSGYYVAGDWYNKNGKSYPVQE